MPVSTAGGAITDANGNVVANYPEVTVYDLRDPSNVPTFFVLRNRPDYHQTYNGLELTATKRLSHRWLMRGNVAYTDWKEHSGSGSYADPTPKIAAGACQGACNGVFVTQSATSGAFQDVFINSKWSFNLTGLYQLPFDFNLGASLTGRQGYPNIVRDDVSLPSGATSQVILHNPVGSSRFDSVYELDLRAAKDFRFFNRLEVTISADLFNAPNQRTILQRTTLASTDEVANGNFNRITELQSPRVWRLGARLTF